VEIVEYLVAECQADVEQRGQYEVQDDRWVLTAHSAVFEPDQDLIRIKLGLGIWIVNFGRDPGRQKRQQQERKRRSNFVFWMFYLGLELESPSS
jgi:hypothetical protein